MPRPSEIPSNPGRSSTSTAMAPETGARIALTPTTANDVAEMWGISPDGQDEVSIKVFRNLPGSRATELITTYPVSQYSLAEVAGLFGPGRYTMTGTGQFHRSTASANVSEEFARGNGWSRQPVEPVTPSGMMAGRALAQLGHGGAPDTSGFLLILEKMMESQDRKFDRLERLVMEQKAAAPASDPMAALAPALALISGVQQNSFQMFTALAQGKVPEAGEDAKPWWADLAAAAMPALGQIGAAVASRAGKPAAPLMPAPQPQTITTSTPAPIPEPAPVEIPNVNPSPLDPIATTLLKNAAPQLAQAAAAIADDEHLLALLEGQIMPAMYPALDRLYAATQAQGPQALAFMGPDFVNERWPRLLGRLVTQDEDMGGADEMDV